jgi:hypothetical protein
MGGAQRDASSALTLCRGSVSPSPSVDLVFGVASGPLPPTPSTPSNGEIKVSAHAWASLWPPRALTLDDVTRLAEADWRVEPDDTVKQFRVAGHRYIEYGSVALDELLAGEVPDLA